MKWRDLFIQNEPLENLSIHNVNEQMILEGFDDHFRKEIMEVLRNRLFKNGEKAFQEWLYQLNFQTPAELEREEFCLHLFDKSGDWIEREIKTLERETGLLWEVQGEDLQARDPRVKKVQIVTRHRLTEVVMDLMDR
jgi:hypothetical protein